MGNREVAHEILNQSLPKGRLTSKGMAIRPGRSDPIGRKTVRTLWYATAPPQWVRKPPCHDSFSYRPESRSGRARRESEFNVKPITLVILELFSDLGYEIRGDLLEFLKERGVVVQGCFVGRDLSSLTTTRVSGSEDLLRLS